MASPLQPPDRLDPDSLVGSKDAVGIRSMFNRIAHRYDSANRLLSMGIDRSWRRRVRIELGSAIRFRPAQILDVCCGTGDLCLELAPLGRIIGVDFAREMLEIGRRKRNRSGAAASIQFAEGDGLNLPFRDGFFDAVTAAFGVRNFEDLPRGLQEMARVIRPGGILAILEFSRPSLPGFAPLFNFYFRRVLPCLGGWVTGNIAAYRYLPASVQAFLEPHQVESLLAAAGLQNLSTVRLTGGVASLYLGMKK